MHFDTLPQRHLGIMKLLRNGQISFYSEANRTFVDICSMGKKYIHVAWLKKSIFSMAKKYVAWQKKHIFDADDGNLP